MLTPIRLRPSPQDPRPAGNDEPFRALLREQPELAWNAIRPLQVEASARRADAGCRAATATQLELRFDVSTTPGELVASFDGVETVVDGPPLDHDLRRCIVQALNGAWTLPAVAGMPFPVQYQGPLFVQLIVPAQE